MQVRRTALSAAVLMGLVSITGAASAATIDLRVLETTDIHANVMDYDYYTAIPAAHSLKLDSRDCPIRHLFRP
ncbi:hypothetical protein [uncultured Endozoicomonas sp.]|uniref:hypothetical protein n=1 Tax=uncultured Endozoicomonas sp. TaxID=432652 RepID=UPI00261CB1BC|nr:hypothetical protein [uncultured Endozoicomonas sp.]